MPKRQVRAKVPVPTTFMERLKAGMLTAEDLAKASPAAFAARMSKGRWRLAPHLALLSRKLMAVDGGALRRLAVSMAPRHGKSEFISKYFPAWYLGRWPEKQVLLVSYEHDFAASWGMKAREVFRESGRLWGLSLSKDRQGQDDWGIAGHEGGMRCAGVGGPITGKGADVLVIDDPVKGAEDAGSEAMREKAWEWYQSTAYTRLEPGGSVILIMTRWHEDDLAGKILAQAKETGEEWEVLNFPAVAEEGDTLGRTAGEALWPERYPVTALERTRSTLSPYWWEALYQGRPMPPGGMLLREEWWRHWEALPEGMDEWWMSVDCTFKEVKGADYVVVQCWARKGEDYLLIDQMRGQRDFVGTVEMVKAMKSRWPSVRYILIEDKANGPAVISALRGRVAGMVAVNPKGGKYSRASAVSGLVEQGRVWLPKVERSPWVLEFIGECKAFPAGKHDDMVDSFSQALARFAGTVREVKEESPQWARGRWPEDEGGPKEEGRLPWFGPALNDAARYELVT